MESENGYIAGVGLVNISCVSFCFDSENRKKNAEKSISKNGICIFDPSLLKGLLA